MTEIQTRPWTDEDLRRLRDAEPSFSAETLSSRFLTGSIRWPASYLASLGSPESWGTTRLGQVALADGDLVGVAECTWLTDSPRPAELSILVADTWQRRGIGRLLATSLLSQCEAAGITHIEAVAQTANTGCLALVRSIISDTDAPTGWNVRSRLSDGLRQFQLVRQESVAAGDILTPFHVPVNLRAAAASTST
ncbi:GNAT family N-acetyltransferase [Paractinoplanes brasiliensis]|uniref:GNAT family N-acetyltransferase n=1 Tax=Paractinoplanes brasiliensis TaxID=52695 RepID=UPI0023B2FD35|nr:GNAT family N-acetyltransferase [Actinoplanes brasiliensis]